MTTKDLKKEPKRTETADTITIDGDLILTKDTRFNKNLVVKGDIKGYWNLNCRNLDCRNLDCLNLNCRNLNCLNLVLCEKLTRKSEKSVIKCKMLIENRSKLEVKEW
jgi:hypothetical protein